MIRIPREFTLNGKKYSVRRGRSPNANSGRVLPIKREMYVYAQSELGWEYTLPHQKETFLHELTHAVLHEMDHPQWNDEPFVERFSALLFEALQPKRTP